MIAMQLKRPKASPAIALIGRITPDVMAAVLRELDNHGAGRWVVSKIGTHKTDGDYFVIDYWPVHRPGCWRMAFGFDGSLWMD